MNPDARGRAWAEVDLAAIRANIAALLLRLGPARSLMAVVKANGYGHGAVQVASAAARAGAGWLGVATVAEGVELRQAGLEIPIAVLAPSAPAEGPLVPAWRLTPLIGDASTLWAVQGAAAAHLEIDTGMGRSGVRPEHAVTLWRRCVEAGIAVEGVATHFADADDPYSDLTAAQRRRFQSCRADLAAAGARFQWVHACNSAALVLQAASETFVPGENLVRPGLLMYGVTPGGGDAPRTGLLPVMSVRARIATVRRLERGDTISYGATCRLDRACRAATVLIGYGDGFRRDLSNQGCVLIRGKRAPILGRVCMDQTVVDVTAIPDASPGDTATVIGADGDESIRVEEIAGVVGASEHEITTCIGQRVPRLYTG